MDLFVRVFGLALILTFSGLLGAQDDEGPKPVEVATKRPSIHSRSLPRLIELAELNSPTIKRFKSLMGVAENDKLNAFWRFFPSLGM